uniref:Uncharacterized protein n=1 Tax=Podarcis muralis TaxID=64176 RepID=A0A670JCV6_PODMU
MSLSLTTDRSSRQARLSGIFWDWASPCPNGTLSSIQQRAREKLIEGQVIELEDGSTAFVQQVTLQKESITFEDGQPVALEDGTMAFIHHAPQEGYDPNTLEAIQLEDGSTAFIHRPVSLSVGSTTLTVQADVGLEELAVGEKDDSFELDSITALKDYASKVRILFCFCGRFKSSCFVILQTE